MRNGRQVKAIPPSLVRPLLVGGAERTPAGIVCAAGAAFCALGWQLHSWVAACVGIFVLSVGMGLLRRIAKLDPLMFQVYPRQMRYRAFYPARAVPTRKASPVKATLIGAGSVIALTGLAYQMTRIPVFGWSAVLLAIVTTIYLCVPNKP